MILSRLLGGKVHLQDKREKFLKLLIVQRMIIRMVSISKVTHTNEWKFWYKNTKLKFNTLIEEKIEEIEEKIEVLIKLN